MAWIRGGWARAGVVLAVLAALAEVGSFVMDNGGFITRAVMEMVRPTQVAAPLPECQSDDKNPLVKALCEDQRDGTVRLEP